MSWYPRIHGMFGSKVGFDIGTGFDNTVRCITFEKRTGKIYVGGDFVYFNNSVNGKIIRINSDGSSDNVSGGFETGQGFYKLFSSYERVNTIVLGRSDSAYYPVYVGGYFGGYYKYQDGEGVYQPIAAPRNIALDINGDVYGAYTPIALGGGYAVLNKFITTDPDGITDPLVAVVFNSTYELYINNTGINLDGEPLSVVYHDYGDGDERIYVVGSLDEFTIYGDPTPFCYHGIGCYDLSGQPKSSFIGGSGFNPAIVDDIAMFSNGDFVVVGSFDTWKGSSRDFGGIGRISKEGTISDSLWNVTGMVPNLTKQAGFAGDGWPRCVKVDFNDNIYVGSSSPLTTYRGSTFGGLIRLSGSGTPDTSFNVGSGFNGAVNCIEFDDSGNCFVGGEFTSYKGVTCNRLAKLDYYGNLLNVV